MSLLSKWFGSAAGPQQSVREEAADLVRQGNTLLAQGKLTAAAARYEAALAAAPENADACVNLGFVLKELGRAAAAAQFLERAVRLAPRSADAHYLLGLLAESRGDLFVAMRHLVTAIDAKPDFGEAWRDLGRVRHLAGDQEGAGQSIGLPLGSLAAWDNLCAGLISLRCDDMAEIAARRIIEQTPQSAIAWSNLAAICHKQGKWQEAEGAARKAIELDAGLAGAWNNLSVEMCELGRYAEAEEAARRALSIDPQLAEAWSSLASILEHCRRHGDAVQALVRLLELDPNYRFAKGRLLHQKMLCCDWEGLEALHESIKRDLDDRRPSAEPFGHQAIATSARELFQCAQLYCAEVHPGRAGPPAFLPKKPGAGKIRIGYLSGEFRHQATSILMVELFELHDRDRFEIIAFDNGASDHTAFRSRLERAFDKIVPIAGLDDAQAAGLIRAEGVDILVNLNGYFGKGRTDVFALRPAPIQVNYLGFPGTIGAPYIDYLIADRIVVPADEVGHYAEKIVFLPHSYQVNDRQRTIAETQYSREMLGLPPAGFVFACFNNNYKITPQQFDAWMRILGQVDGSVLWLLEDNASAAGNLRREAERRGIAPHRLIFAGRMALPEHLARHRAADLFLDTLPYNAHTTASDALWAGLPVLTQLGTTFPGRVAASLLTAIGLTELIVPGPDEYEKMAVELARHPHKLAAIRDKLARNRLTTPLFDTPQFARGIESAYAAMYDRLQAGGQPDHIYIEH